MYLLGCDSGYWFGFYPFGEMINGYYQEFHLPLAGGEGAEDIHSPFSKGPWGLYGIELFLFLVDEVAMFLAWFALSDVVLAVYFYCQSKVTGSKDSSGHSACTGMVAANAFV